MTEQSFEDEIARVLPSDLPHREQVVAKAAKHLALIEEANRSFNLTRITNAREAAIKHVLDSLLPWRLFGTSIKVLDAGTGAGFPGIPLALVLPEVRFTLAESIGKKARFVQSAVTALELHNVTIAARRAEDILPESRPDVIIARAVAPLSRALKLFGPAVQRGSRALLYKGPDADTEIAESAAEAQKLNIRMQVIERYELPESAGSRTVVELRR
jgi:16S rRNA (guanine527-N7)-methyltransferase